MWERIEDNLDKIIIAIIIIVIIGVAYALYYDFFVTQPKINAFIVKCEDVGGVPIKNARRVGKVTHVSYVCLKKDAVIDVYANGGSM